jgi:hypothetical protein
MSITRGKRLSAIVAVGLRYGLRQSGEWALRRNHARQANPPGPRQTLSRPTVHRADLGRESG